MTVDTRTALIPQAEAQFTTVLAQLGELLMLLQLRGDDDGRGGLPELLTGQRALNALDNLWGALFPRHRPPRVRAGRLLAPAGDQQLLLVPTELPVQDLAVVGEVVTWLNAPEAAGGATDVLTDVGMLWPTVTAREVVEGVTGLHRVLALELTCDGRALMPAIVAVAAGSTAVLTAKEHNAYRRTLDRITSSWPQLCSNPPSGSINRRIEPY